MRSGDPLKKSLTRRWDPTTFKGPEGLDDLVDETLTVGPQT